MKTNDNTQGNSADPTNPPRRLSACVLLMAILIAVVIVVAAAIKIVRMVTHPISDSDDDGDDNISANMVFTAVTLTASPSEATTASSSSHPTSWALVVYTVALST